MTPSGVHEHSTRHATRHFPEAQCAFKILMIHEIVQFALRIAFRCVLHRFRSQDIHRCKLYTFIYLYLEYLQATTTMTITSKVVVVWAALRPRLIFSLLGLCKVLGGGALASSTCGSRHCWLFPTFCLFYVVMIAGGRPDRRRCSHAKQATLCSFSGFEIVDLDVIMIPPQVHLRRPCYDFTFL